MEEGRSRGHDSRQLTEVLRRILALSSREQLIVFERLGDAIGAEYERPTVEQVRARRMVEALHAIKAAYDAVGLGYEEPLSSTAFNDINRRFGLGWHTSRVHRAWGSWGRAKSVWLNGSGERGPGALAARLSLRRLNTRHRDPEDSVAMWLASRPEHRSMRAYDAWVRSANQRLGRDELKHIASAGVSAAMNRSFPRAVEDVRIGAIRDRDAGRFVTVGRYRFATMHGVGHLLGCATASAGRLAREERDFPAWVARVGDQLLWLVEDVEAYRSGGRSERHEGELQHAVLDMRTMAEILGVSSEAVRQRVAKGSHAIPRPCGGLRRTCWDAESIRAWLEEHPDQGTFPTDWG
jgi:predicted DNA-binding transcriptional regulator AlpA